MKKIFIFIFVFLFLITAAVFLARNIIIKKSLNYYLNSNFGIEASFGEVNIGFKKIIIDETNLVKDNFQFKAKSIEVRYKVNFPYDSHYQLFVDNLSIQRKEIGDFSLSIKFKENKLYFYNLESTFIDSSALLSGYLDLGDFNNICIDLVANNLPLSDIISLFGDKKKINLEGKFSGKANCCFKNNKISYLDLDVDNLEGGIINFKEKTSLDFLKNRIDKKSYLYLLDNLKNYKYDKGNIGVKTDKNDLILEANFLSEELGKRNITIKLHKVFAK